MICCLIRLSNYGKNQVSYKPTTMMLSIYDQIQWSNILVINIIHCSIGVGV